MTWGFDVIFDLRLNHKLSKQWKHLWFETPSRSLWRHCNGTDIEVNTLRNNHIPQKIWDVIDLLHNSHNAPVPYPTMHYFVTEMCTGGHISVTKWCIVGYLYNALWDMWDGFIFYYFPNEIYQTPLYIYVCVCALISNSSCTESEYYISWDWFEIPCYPVLCNLCLPQCHVFSIFRFHSWVTLWNLVSKILSLSTRMTRPI